MSRIVDGTNIAKVRAKLAEIHDLCPCLDTDPVAQAAILATAQGILIRRAEVTQVQIGEVLGDFCTTCIRTAVVAAPGASHAKAVRA